MKAVDRIDLGQISKEQGEAVGIECESRRQRQLRPTHQWRRKPAASVVPGSRVHISGAVGCLVAARDPV